MLRSLGSAFKPLPRYGRKPPFVLVNGLAEQAETWFRNLPAWRRKFDVLLPNILTYDGELLHDRIARDEPISIDYLVGELHHFLTRFVQTPPYHLGGSSTGGKVIIEFAARYPDLVRKIVLFGPSGVSDEERLPIVQGVRRHDIKALVESVFNKPRRADRRLYPFYKDKLANRRWRTGLIRTVRGTLNHPVRHLFPQIPHPVLMIVGRNDMIVDPVQAEAAGRTLKNGKLVLLDDCGHAPHLEHARKVTLMVTKFLLEKSRT